MTGIYKITNNINGHSYIGQSRNILKRWTDEKSNAFNSNEKCYNYPLSRAFRKYGIQNFTFEIIEECTKEELNYKENYWINYFSPAYNQTTGKDYQVHGKLTQQIVEEIQYCLMQDAEGNVSHIDLAKKYNVSDDTIQAINAGRSWIDSNLTYPLHLSKFDKRRNDKRSNCCIDCGTIIGKNSIRCMSCYHINMKKQKTNCKSKPISRENLKERIRKEAFTTIAKDYNLSDNGIRKWCKFYNLPYKTKDIKKYSDEEWLNI